MVDGIGNTGILGYGIIRKVAYSVAVNGNIFKKSVSLDCLVNVRLRLFIKVYNLCIATTLEVEYSIVIPAVLVIANKKTLGVGGKGCFTGS